MLSVYSRLIFDKSISQSNTYVGNILLCVSRYEVVQDIFLLEVEDKLAQLCIPDVKPKWISGWISIQHWWWDSIFTRLKAPTQFKHLKVHHIVYTTLFFYISPML